MIWKLSIWRESCNFISQTSVTGVRISQSCDILLSLDTSSKCKYKDIYNGLDYIIVKGLNISISYIIYSVDLNTNWVVLWISSEQFNEFCLTRLIKFDDEGSFKISRDLYVLECC